MKHDIFCKRCDTFVYILHWISYFTTWHLTRRHLFINSLNYICFPDKTFTKSAQKRVATGQNYIGHKLRSNISIAHVNWVAKIRQLLQTSAWKAYSFSDLDIKGYFAIQDIIDSIKFWVLITKGSTTVLCQSAQDILLKVWRPFLWLNSTR